MKNAACFVLVLAAWLIACSGIAAAQDAPADNPLRGPEVPESRTRTLVKKTMTGRLERLDVRPEVAALQQLDLSPETAEEARGIIEARTDAITMLLVEELDAVRAISDRSRDGKTEEAERIFRGLWEAFEPGAQLSPLLDDLAPLLDESQRVIMAALVEEYWEARIDWELRSSEERRTNERVRARVADRLAYQAFQQEVRRAYNASLKRYHDALEGIYTAVEPTRKQREQIRSMVIEHIKDTKLRATPAQRRAMQMRIYRMLDDDRKEKLFGYLTEVVIRD